MKLGFVAIILLVYLVTRGQSAVIKGKIGELKVANQLRKHLPSPSYQVFNDLTVPTNNGTTQIDHVVISPFGIFVIETKNYEGWIFGSSNDAKWTVTHYRSKIPFPNPIHQNYAHLKALETITGLDESVFHSIVAFVGQAQFKTWMPEEVCFPPDLVERIKLKNQPLLSPAQMTGAIQAIQADRLEPGFKTDAAHVKSLHERFGGTVQIGVERGIAKGVGQLVFVGGVKLLAFAAVVVFGVWSSSHLQSTLANLAITKPQSQLQPSSQPTQPSMSTEKPGSTTSKAALISGNFLQQNQAENMDLATLRWERSLRCGYSIDTNRCSCYERSGPKADIPFERCKALATGGGK